MSSKLLFTYSKQDNGGKPPVLSWSKDSNYLAVGTDTKSVYVLNKRGKLLVKKELPVSGRVQMIDWDCQNEMVAILVEGLPYVLLWAPFTTNHIEELHFENSKVKAVWLMWSKTHPILTFANEKGYLNFYQKKTKRQIPTIGKHFKRIVSGDWNNEGLLITSSQDRIITVSNYSAETAGESLTIKSEAKELKWTTPKTDERAGTQTTVCGIMNQKTLLVYDITEKGIAPLELIFESKYGKIMDYYFFGDGYVVLGFTEGYYCRHSIYRKEISSEIKSQRVFNAPLEAISINENSYKMVLAGENKIKVYNLTDWKEAKGQSFDLPSGSGKVASMQFSADGSVLVVTTHSGFLYGYLLSSGMQVASYHQIVGVMSSLTQVLLMNCSSAKKGHIFNNLTLNIEPSDIYLGPSHLAAKSGNIVKYYRWLRGKTLISGGQEVNEVSYDFVVKRIEMNETFAAVLSDKGRLTLHTIEKSTEKERVFPPAGDKTIVQFCLTKIFLITLDSVSAIKYYHIEDKNIVLEHKPGNVTLRFFANKNGTKLILQSHNGEISLFVAATETYHTLQQVTQRVDKVLWDTETNNEFIVVNGTVAYSYIISRNNIFGKVVSPVYEILSLEKVFSEDGEPTVTRIEKNVLAVSGGFVFFVAGNAISYVPLTSHAFLHNYTFENDSPAGHSRYFFVNVGLRRFGNCLVAAKYLKDKVYFDALGRKALENLDLATSIKTFQLARNTAMVLTLEHLMHENERELLIGHSAMILGNYQLAQEAYLKSSEALNALHMRCDIQDWFIALSLTKTIAPQQEAFINKRLGLQTESQGNNTEALKHFERSIVNSELKTVDRPTVERHNMECFAGIARTSIKLGDVQRGYNLAREIKDKSLLQDIAVVCENMKQFNQAAQLFQKADSFERAVTLYLSQRMFKQAAPLMKKVKTPALLVKFGKAKETEAAYKEAEEAYEQAEAWEDVVRINLNNFDNLEKPKQILHTKCSTSTVALMVATYCEKRSLWSDAVEFYLMANRKEEAFVMARLRNQMDVYANCLKDCTSEERNQIAQYYEGTSSWDKAAKQYELAKNPMKALKLYIKAGELYIKNMLELVERNSTQEPLVQELLDYLMGETDGTPKDPIFTYKLYRILKSYIKAAKIVVSIAEQEQEAGNYKNAHEILFQSYQDIKKANVPIPLDLEKKLSVLHSYIIAVKYIAKMDLHAEAALLLNKVAKNILQFPAHAASILSTIVIRAMRADLKTLAYNWAIVVCRPEYRDSIPQAHSDRIKRVAMRPVNDEEVQPKSPCPFCKELVNDYQEDCHKCMNYLPFCVASGKHIVLQDLCFCKHCKFPANHTSIHRLLDYLKAEPSCPMCNTTASPEDFVLVGEAGLPSLKRPPPPKEDKK